MGDQMKKESTEVGGNYKNPAHPLKEIPLSKIFFENQSKVEREGEQLGIGAGGNFREVFKRTLGIVIETAKQQGWPELAIAGGQQDKSDEIADKFMDEFSRIRMEDTIYHDTYSAGIELFRVSDSVVVYTQGDAGIQPEKIQRSGIWQLLENAREKSLSESSLKMEISTKKEAELSRILNEFVGNDKSEIVVVFYDDQTVNFAKAKKYFSEFEEKSGVKIEPLFVWAKRGRFAEASTTREEDLQNARDGGYEVAETLNGLVELIKEKPDGRRTLVLLDFDGAISDNRLMRVRQAHVAYTNIMTTLKEMVQGVQTDREKVKEMYLTLSGLWKKA